MGLEVRREIATLSEERREKSEERSLRCQKRGILVRDFHKKCFLSDSRRRSDSEAV